MRAAAATAALAALLCAGAAQAQVEGVPITGDRLGGFVLPIEPGNWPLLLRATSAWTWKVDSTQRVLLRGKVNVQLAAYDFYADSAVLWIERIPSAKGLITQVALWFPETSEPTKAAGLGAGGSNLFVTASTMGDVTLRAVLVEPKEPPRTGDLMNRAEARLAAYLRGLAERPPAARTQPDVLRPAAPPPPPPMKVGELAPADPSVAAAVEARAIASTGRTGGSLIQSSAALPADAPVPGAKPALPAPIAAPTPQPGDATVRAKQSPIVAPDSFLAFAADHLEVDSATDTITLTGGANLDLLPRMPGKSARALQLHAERSVVFLQPGTLAKLRKGTTEIDASSVTGIYLEGDVDATDFQYTVRAKRAYYDLQLNRATLVEGVLRTQDRSGMPVVARAKELRQYSQDEWQGDKLVVSTSEFFEPHLSIGLERATITRTWQDEAEASPGVATGAGGPGGTGAGGGAGTGVSGIGTLVRGENLTLRAGGTPFLWLPGFEGDGTEKLPFRGATLGYNGFTGTQIEARFDPFGLLGTKPPEDTDLSLTANSFTNNGVGGGLRGTAWGANVDLLGIYDFGNVEQTSAGATLRSPLSFRGIASADDTLRFTDTAKLQVQASYVSDESFMQVWRQREFATQFQKETSAYLVNGDDRSEASLLISAPTNAVITNSSQLASRPYQVEKYPEFAYKRWGDSLFGDRLTWQQEYSASAMALRLGQGSEETTGVLDNAFQWLRPGGAFSRDTTLGALYSSSGYNEDTMTRLYTRQELAMQWGEGGWKFAPFAAGNVYGYISGDRQSYDASADSIRFMLSTGFRSSADIVADHDTVDIAALDVHRLRHVFTPYVNSFVGWNSTPNLAYAIYDQELEGATASQAVQVGMRHRLQTMRGGAGNWQSVDWITWDVGVTWNAGGDDLARNYTDGARYRQSPYPQYFNWRPELSQWGRNAYTSLKVAASSSLTLQGSMVYLLDSDLPDAGAGAFGLDQASRGSVGATLQHSPDVSTFVEYRSINNFSPESIYLSDALLASGVDYQVGKAYHVSFVPTWDLKENDFRLFTLNLQREAPDFTLLGTFGYDAIQDQYFGGINIRIGGDAGGQPMMFDSLPINR
jgi:hypothetical protein